MSFVGLARLTSSMFAFVLLHVGGDRAETRYFQYQRSIVVRAAGPACAVLDPAVFAHASGSLKDLRLISDGHELPYAITVNGSAQVESEPASIANLHESRNGAEFDLEMPPRPYTQLDLRLEGRDFIAHVALTGSDKLRSGSATSLGTFSVFDLSSRGLSRNTTISLQETSLRYLHVKLRGRGFRIRGVEVPPSREEQTLFTPVAETRALAQHGTKTIASFRVPARVPIERASVTLDAGFAGNFSRGMRVTARALMPGSIAEQVTGTILRVNRGAIHMEQQASPASLGANLQSDAEVEVAIENEGKSPLPLVSVVLSMRMRTICFDAPGPIDLFYGDRSLESPRTHYQPSERWSNALLGPERFNPSFRERVEPEGWLERHRGLFWGGMLGLVALGGALGMRIGRRRRRAS